ncbi:MAG: hypothetical protein H8E72_02110 [Candidatus Marinimicrobia bacterium]|nr:hypothetical protein [Candidatus Neomarinimicrobiota bacterium]
MSNPFIENKKGQQLTMPIARSEESPELLSGHELKTIDIRSDWKNLLPIIYSNENVQSIMEKSYQDFQEGFKLRDFKHKDALKGAWSFQDIHSGIYPYTLTTTDWVFEYEEKEWDAQASEIDKDAKSAILLAIEKCKNINGNIDILHGLEQSNGYLNQKYSPRPNQPETWRPQNAAHWTVKWVKVLAEFYYSNLSNDWRIIANNTHAVVAGFTRENSVYLLDIMLLSTDPQEIYQKLTQ